MQGVAFRDVWRFVWSYFLRFPWHVTGAYAAMSVNVVAEIMNPLILGWLIDAVSVTTLDETAFRTALFFAFLYGVQSFGYHVSLRTAHFLNCFTDSRVERLVAAETLDRIQHFSTDWHVNSFAGSIVTKIKRGMRAIHTFYDTICYEIYPAAGVAVALVVLISLRQPVLGLIFGSFSVAYTIFSILLSVKFVMPKNREANAEDNKIGAAIADSVSSNATVKAFGKEKYEASIFERVSRRWMIAERGSWIVSNKVALVQSFVITTLKFSVFAGAVWYWFDGTFSAGDVAFIIGSYDTFTSYLRSIGDRIRDMQQAVNDMEDVVHFQKMPIQIVNHPAAKNLKVVRGRIEFQNVTFQYDGQPKPVFQNLSLTIEPGESVALVGHSGGGKTSFVKLIQRLYDVDSGSVVIDGQDISRVRQTSLRQAVGVVPQEPILFHRSLADNISYAKLSAKKSEILEAARDAYAAAFIEKLPKKYDTLVGERGVKLSGGERQRVAIARAMLANAPILVLDEATSSLDSESEKYIQKALKKLMQKRTTIVVAHRLSTIKSADRILVFEKGKIVEDGSHEKLLRKKNGVYKKLYELQAGGFIAE